MNIEMINRANEKPLIAMIVPEITRNDPEGLFMRFLRDNASELRKEFKIVATKGTCESIVRTGFFEKGKHIECLRSGAHGGIVEIAYKVVTGELGVVIFLYDPEEVRSESPETRALTRVCIHKKINLLTTVETADYWIKYQAHNFISSWKIRNKDWKQGKEGKDGSMREIGIENSTIALIAHDAKKKEMKEFIMDQQVQSYLKKFKRIIATGTTGTLIRGWLYENKELADKVILANSGPEGGDVQIAYEVLNNKCQVVIFFHDPMTAHPHDADISLLRRTCQLPKVQTILLSDLSSAKAWIASSISSPITLVKNPSEILRKNYKILKEVIIVPEDEVKDLLNIQENIPCEEDGWGRTEQQWRQHRDNWLSIIRIIARVAVPYIDSILRREEEDEVVMAVNWGPTMDIVAEEIEKFSPKPIKTLKVIPMTGIPGVVQNKYFPNEIATRIANSYKGEYFLCPHPMFSDSSIKGFIPNNKRIYTK